MASWAATRSSKVKLRPWLVVRALEGLASRGRPAGPWLASLHESAHPSPNDQTSRTVRFMVFPFRTAHNPTLVVREPIRVNPGAHTMDIGLIHADSIAGQYCFLARGSQESSASAWTRSAMSRNSILP